MSEFELQKSIHDAMGNFEAVENPETLEALENLVRKNPRSAAEIIGSAMKSHSRGFGRSSGFSAPAVSKEKLAGNFNITITRNAANVAGNLLIPIFAPQELDNGYTNILGAVTGGSGYLQNVQVGLYSGFAYRTSAVFTYSVNADGTGGTDTVTVTCAETAYPSLLRAMITDTFRCSTLRYIVSNTTYANQQFSAPFSIVSRTMLGKQLSDSLTPNGYLSPLQFQSGRLDVLGGTGLEATKQFDRQTSLVIGITNQAAFSVTLSMFLEQIQGTGL